MTETFGRNLSGSKARVANPNPQPQASLASSFREGGMKRRQRASKPCDRASKSSMSEPLGLQPAGAELTGPPWVRYSESDRGPRAGQRREEGSLGTCEIPNLLLSGKN